MNKISTSVTLTNKNDKKCKHIKDNKKTIDINQVRNLIQNLNKSSFNEKPRFVLIDNLEYLNLIFNFSPIVSRQITLQY